MHILLVDDEAELVSALAERLAMAMMGTRPPPWRMRRVASTPSITGIWMSMQCL